ncbi:MAG: DUF1566 domain-containing protein [Spirochaetales bacterium]|nr:DUF1566 domain-containing protein [Candidatus Physcosoma equi]
MDEDNTAEDPDGPDNLKSDVCGWRYLEAAAADACVESRTNDFSHYGLDTFGFGHYKLSASESPRASVTEKGIGKGQANTTTLVNAMGENCENVYVSATKGSSLHNDYYAAQVCAKHVENNVSDWFLPSIDELYALITLLKTTAPQTLGDQYWSSTLDASAPATYASTITVANISGSGSTGRGSRMYVRPVRSF